jgi:hypothetical protein
MLRCAGRFVIAVAFSIAVACSDTPTSTSGDFSDPEIAPLWAEGQNALLQYNQQWVAAGEPPIRGDVLAVKHTRFDFVSHREPLSLNGERVAGYFEPSSKRIHYHEPLMDGAIPHEAGHAILYELKDPRWHCVGHPNCHP